MMLKRILIAIFMALTLIFQSAPPANAESRYTREKAEELFHLIKWHEYTPGTFEKALREQKPVFLVISAPSWCYWCHVYESEDYLYHPDLYPFINENFIAVFVDSDKRPDLTKKYLEGGWPSTILLTPDLRRISGFSGPRDPNILREYLEEIVNFLKDESFGEYERELTYRATEPVVPEEHHFEQIEKILLDYIDSTFDPEYGGFILGMNEQKFPSPLVLKYLLEEYDKTGNGEYLNIVKTTFNHQYTDMDELETGYHLYDPVEGGFHRYSTKRDWTIPHYEKMLGDQARIIRAYAHLLTSTNEDKVRDAVERSISYITAKFYNQDGGFYSSQDAYLEGEYYALTKEEREKIAPPHIDKTIIMNSNSEMIITFLYLYKLNGKDEYASIARKSLHFLMDKMTGGRGAYHYFDFEKKQSFLTEQTLSNSWAMLAFLEGHDILREQKFLKKAKELADYSLDNLYDWNSGGFFERNSNDTYSYAPHERIDLTKAYQENAVFSYSMLNLYLATSDLKYLESGLKTLGFLLTINPGRLDEMYYTVKAFQLVNDNDLIDEYRNKKEEIERVIEQGKEHFFLYKIFEVKKEKPATEDVPKLQDKLSGLSYYVLSALAFLAGVLSFLSPCTLPILPAYFAQGFSSGKGGILKNTVFFFLGLATVFSLFGMGASLVGSIFREHRIIFTQIAAAIIIVFGILEIFGKGFSGLNIYLKGSRRTPVGSYLFGSVFAIGWSACIGPILASLLFLSATSGTYLKGTSLLFIYALGLALPLMLVSLFFDRVRSKGLWKFLQGRGMRISLFKIQFEVHTTHLVSGIILIVLGIFIFNDYLYKLNQLTFQSDYVQQIIIEGEEYLKNLFAN
jgi:uncharacterized protein YyaL (SSP411 family)